MDDIEEKISALSGIKAKVSKIHVDGLSRTRDQMIVNMVQCLFKQVDSFEDLIAESDKVRNRLYSLGIFKHIHIEVDVDKQDSTAYEVTYNVEESNFVYGALNTQVENKGTSIVFKSAIPNLTGRADMFIGEYHRTILNDKNSSEINLGFKIPLKPWTFINPKLSTTIFHGSGDKPSAAFKELNRGLLVDLSFNSFPSLLHSIRWEGKWRQLTALKDITPFKIREEFGHSLKSSIFFAMAFHYQQPDGKIRHVVKMDQEYAGVGGNVNFLKHELSLQSILLQYAGFSLHSFLNLGILKYDDFISIADKFFLGGPSTVRGFHYDGIGPHIEQYALGGTRYWMAGLHLDIPLPSLRHGKLNEWFKTHLFVNAGNLGDFAYKGDIYKYFDQLIKRTRVSTGFGLVFTIGPAVRFELNYCIPLYYQPGDQHSRGLQFGAGINTTR